MADNSDILVEIPTSELRALIEFYQRPSVLEKCRFVVNTILTAIPWKESSEIAFKEGIKFYSPNGSWKVDGTIVVFFLFGCYDVFVFTLEDSCDTLYRTLMETKLIDYSKDASFVCVHEDIYPAVMKALKDLEVENVTPDLPEGLPGVMFTKNPEVSKNLRIECPEEVYTAKLTESHVETINSAWPHKYPGSEKLISAIIKLNGGCGIFLKRNNQLVSWALIHRFGIGMLQTDENFTRKGYGLLTLNVISKELALQGIYPLGNVRGTNEPSLKLFNRVGYEKRCNMVFIYINLIR